jgi:hypothetical protein
VLTFKSAIGPDGVRVTFSEKPPDAIRSILKANGFRWSHVGGFWWRRAVKGAADFLAALDRAVGPRRPDGACWSCGAPEGYFRPYGAATPVYCDACHAKRQEQPDLMGVDRAYEDACRDACGL